MALTSRWYDASETAALLVVLRSLRRADLRVPSEPELQQLLNAIDVELDHFQRSLAIDIATMIALLAPNRRRMSALRQVIAEPRKTLIGLRSLMRLHRRLLDATRGRMPRARLLRDLYNLRDGSTSIPILVDGKQASPTNPPRRGRPLVLDRVYRRELVLALRMGARRAAVVDRDAPRILTVLDNDPEKLRKACDAVIGSRLLHDRQDRDEPLTDFELGLLKVYEDHLGKPPAETVYESKQGKRPGPAIRFLQGCVSPLTTPPSIAAARHRVREYRRQRVSQLT